MKRLMRDVLPVLALVGLCGLVAPAHAANMLANPGFEAAGGGYSGWFTFGAGVQLSTAATDNIMHTGAAAAKIYGGFNGCPFAPSFNVGGFGQAFVLPLSSNTTFEFSGQAYMASSDTIPGTNTCSKNRCIVKLAFFNATTGGTELQGSEYVIGDGNTVKNRWNTFSITSSAPANARRVEALVLYLQPACDPGSVFVDDVQLNSYATPVASGNLLSNPAFSSGLTGWTTFGNVFADGRAFAGHSAGGAAKLFGTFSPGSSSGLYQSFPASPGSTWEFSLNAMTSCSDSPIFGTNDNLLVAHIGFFDANGAEIVGGPQAVALNAASPIGAWTPTQLAGTAPVGTATVRCYVLFEQPNNLGGAAFVDDLVFRATPVTLGVNPGAASLALSAPSPNPSRGNARLSYSLPTESDLSIRVYDVAGRGVATLLEGRRPAGNGSIQWDGRRADGSRAAAGIYQVVLRSNGATVSRRMVLAD